MSSKECHKLPKQWFRKVPRCCEYRSAAGRGRHAEGVVRWHETKLRYLNAAFSIQNLFSKLFLKILDILLNNKGLLVHTASFRRAAKPSRRSAWVHFSQTALHHRELQSGPIPTASMITRLAVAGTVRSDSVLPQLCIMQVTHMVSIFARTCSARPRGVFCSWHVTTSFSWRFKAVS